MVDTRPGSLAVRVRGNGPVAALSHNLFVDDKTLEQGRRGLRPRAKTDQGAAAPKLAPKYWKPLGYLYDIGFTRDVWMHRVDLSRAIGRTFDATAAHDGRIVADIIAEWATTHRDPFTLNLTGPAGGTHSQAQPPPGSASTWTPSTAAASSPAAEPRRRPPPPTPPLEHSAPRSPMEVR